MRFDTVIMGGGLAGLTAGIMLQKVGMRTAIVSTGKSALHFCCGSLDLLGYTQPPERKPLSNPITGISSLPVGHPYSILGADSVKRFVTDSEIFLRDCGINLTGSSVQNHWRATVTGAMKPAWLTVDGYATVETPAQLAGKHIALVGVKGYLDFYPKFLAYGLERLGARVSIGEVYLSRFSKLRTMRANIMSRLLQGDGVDEIAVAINRAVPAGADCIWFPGILGGEMMENANRLRHIVDQPLWYVPTMGSSVPGIRMQITLINHYRHVGGTMLQGDTVRQAYFNDDKTRVTALRTNNLGEDHLHAENFIFAAGSFFSGGLRALPDRIAEPVIGLEVHAPADRSEWFDKDIFKPQPFMQYGITTDNEFRGIYHNRPLKNLFVIGSALPHTRSLEEGSGAGVAMVTAQAVAEKLI